MANVSLRHVSKTFKSGVTAVRDCTVEANDGEFSGCGRPVRLWKIDLAADNRRFRNTG